MLAATCGAVLGSGPASAQPPAASNLPLRAVNPILQASLTRISGGSALWRDALDTLAPTGRHAIVLTAEQVIVADPASSERRRFDPAVLAEVAPVPSDTGQVHVVMVVVNLALLQETHRTRHSLPWEFEADLDRILVHEIYGHAFPYLLAGHLSGRCADPAPAERPADACSIRRENAVRAELGLGRRTDRGLDGLALTRPESR